MDLLRSSRKLRGERPISREARDAILVFCRARKGEVSSTRFRTYLSRLPQVAARLGQDFLAPTRETVVRFKEAFPDDQYKTSSREGSWYVVRAFWTWWFDQKGEMLPYYLKIRFPKNGEPRIGPTEVLTRDDVAKIAAATTSLRDRAWVWSLYNSRARPGELYRLRVGDVVVHDGYLELFLNREKGGNERPAPVYEDAVPALLGWLDVHPGKGDSSSPLWVSTEGHGKKRGEIVSYREMYNVTREASKAAEIAKPAHPYAFRHAGLTDLAKDPLIPESILAAAAGWVPGSRRARTYVHVANKDVTTALNARYGIVPVKESKPTVRPALRCGRCKAMNGPDANFCTTCGGPLTLASVGEMREIETNAKTLAGLLRNPKVAEILARELAATAKRSRASRG
jgi:integrase